jgi:hypothetical protein
MSIDPNSRIRALIESFIDELTGLIREAALESVRHALGEDEVPTPPPARARGRRARPPPMKVAPKVPVKVAPTKTPKRDPEVIAALTEKLGAFITAHPGLRIEEIGKALAVKGKDLALPARKLIEAKAITTKGQKRATTYYGV